LFGEFVPFFNDAFCANVAVFCVLAGGGVSFSNCLARFTAFRAAFLKCVGAAPDPFFVADIAEAAGEVRALVAASF
jgi:hypothetical protein